MKKNYNINTESWYDTAGYKTKRLLNKVYYKDIEIRVYSKTYQPNDAMRTIWHYGFSNKQKNIPSTETKEQEQYYKEKIIDYCNKNFKLPSGHEEYAEYILDYTGKNLDEAMNMKASPYDFNGEMRKIYFILQGVLKNNSHKLIIDFIKKNFTAGWYDKDGKLLKKIL